MNMYGAYLFFFVMLLCPYLAESSSMEGVNNKTVHIRIFHTRYFIEMFHWFLRICWTSKVQSEMCWRILQHQEKKCTLIVLMNQRINLIQFLTTNGRELSAVYFILRSWMHQIVWTWKWSIKWHTYIHCLLLCLFVRSQSFGQCTTI